MTAQNSGPKDALAFTSNSVIETSRQALFDLSKDVHAHPELNYEEFYSSNTLAGFLEQHDLMVARGIGGVETAFRATIPCGAGDGPTIAVLAEYDALPEIGHGCGHNLIAMAAMGAALGLQANAQDLPGSSKSSARRPREGWRRQDSFAGGRRLRRHRRHPVVPPVLQPHHRSGGPPPGARAGASPWSATGTCSPDGPRHAAAAPEAGINALNAVIHLFTGIDALRQHLRDDVRMHGVITDGGTAPNVVPEFAAANFMLRSRDGRYLSDEVVGKVMQVAEGAAAMTGSRLEVEESSTPSTRTSNPNLTLAQAVGANLQGPRASGWTTRSPDARAAARPRTSQRQPGHARL